MVAPDAERVPALKFPPRLWARGARPRPHPMNAPTALNALLSQAAEPARLREIPYNYTSFSDREIVIRLLGERG